MLSKMKKNITFLLALSFSLGSAQFVKATSGDHKTKEWYDDTDQKEATRINTAVSILMIAAVVTGLYIADQKYNQGVALACLKNYVEKLRGEIGASHTYRYCAERLGELRNQIASSQTYKKLQDAATYAQLGSKNALHRVQETDTYKLASTKIASGAVEFGKAVDVVREKLSHVRFQSPIVIEQSTVPSQAGFFGRFFGKK